MNNEIEEIKGKTFGSVNVFIDNKNFIDCIFNESTLTYQGLGRVGFQGCSFNSAKWSLDKYAWNTVGFLHAIYHGMGAVGKHMVEGTFNRIKGADPMSSEISKDVLSINDLPEELGDYKKRVMTQDFVIIEYSKKPVFRAVMEELSNEFIDENLLFDVKAETVEEAVEKIKLKILQSLRDERRN